MGHGSIRPRRGAQRKPLGVDLLGQRQQRPGQARELAEVGRPGRPSPLGAPGRATCPTLSGRAALGGTWAPLAAGRVPLAGRAQERLPDPAVPATRSMRC